MFGGSYITNVCKTNKKEEPVNYLCPLVLASQTTLSTWLHFCCINICISFVVIDIFDTSLHSLGCIDGDIKDRWEYVGTDRHTV